MGPAPFDQAWNLLFPTIFTFSSPMIFGNFSSHFVLMINNSRSTYEQMFSSRIRNINNQEKWS